MEPNGQTKLTNEQMEFKEHQGSEVLFICVAVILKLHVDQWI
jgi:hypothetical protein